jgi:hypothetical protein
LKFKTLLIALLFLCAFNSQAQTFIHGVVVDENNLLLDSIKVTNTVSNEVVYTDSQGNYRIEYVIGKKNSLSFECKTCHNKTISIPKLFKDEDYKIDVQLDMKINNLKGYKLTEKIQQGGLILIKPNSTRPSVTGDFVDYIKTLAGVSSNNELSSQYNVRGGSYDENLIYVNDFEVYRPQLIRSGQQEGLSFINGDMVNNVSFSAGGFESRYGDKLSSVLDVNYRAPKTNRAGFQIGALGSSFYVDGIIKAKDRVGIRDSVRFSYIIGGRYRGNKNILNSLDAIGLYKSRFGDLQSLMTLYLNSNNRIELLLNFAQNKYQFEPEFQKTTFGTLQSALQLSIGLDGQEIMNYTSLMGGLSFVKQFRDDEFKLMFSVVNSTETEHYDIQGLYQISEINNDLGSSNFGESKSLLGLGYFINHARNDLDFNIINIAHIATIKLPGIKSHYQFKDKTNSMHPSKLLYGFKFQTEVINDVFKEWKYGDSSDYNINPFPKTDSTVNLNYSVRTKANIRNERISGYAQFHQGLGNVNELSLVAGVRYLYSSLNGQALVSPRFQVNYEPNKKYNLEHRNDSPFVKKKNILIKGAFGYYYQAPFYREMRDFDGNVNTALKAQRSIHYVSGMEFSFKKFGRPFKFSGELFYKDMDYLVPYILDNIRVRYYGTNSSRGYAGGADFRVNGEFIKGLESWFTVSLLKTNETITYINSDGKTVESPSLRRPTDRRVSTSIVFQDEMRTNKDYRVHLMLNFGSGLPYYLGGTARYKEGNTIPAYKRVDIGFSKILIGGDKTKLKSKKIKKMWVGIDVYNLLQINNVISYIWVKDYNNTTYGVPNYLTGRRLNARLVIDL